ncbi:MAG: endoglucanase [Myxococcales bacterium]|jgi:hypothetical protein|nr:endoglucanase [Myxococcales bacterium]
MRERPAPPRLGLALGAAAIVLALVGCEGAEPFYRHALVGGGSGAAAGTNDAGEGGAGAAGGVGDAGDNDVSVGFDLPAAGETAADVVEHPLIGGGDDGGGDAGDAADGEIGCGSCALGVLYQCEGTTANTIRATFSLVNETAAPIPLREVTIRYWFTGAGGTSPWQFACDNGMLGVAPDNVEVTGSVTNVFKPVTPARPGADRYFEVGFTVGAGSLLPRQLSLFRTRVYRQDYSTINQADDYSFNNKIATFGPWSRVTLYRNGTLIQGDEPLPP